MNKAVLINKMSAVLLLFIMPCLLRAQQTYMLSVGINNYTNTTSDTIITPQGRLIHNLHGCVNDANNMAELFTDYYGFPVQNITKLTDRAATRENIINALTQLAAVCKHGDYMVFYYSGHGSLEYNDTTERILQKKYRNSIVPADASTGTVPDINNLEQNDLLFPFVQNGVHLTVIMDACYSGTNTRGATLYEAAASKEVEPVPEAFATPVVQQKTTVLLYKYGAVTLSACQDNEESKETVVNGVSCGAFSYCLENAVKSFSTASVQELYSLAIAQLKFYSYPQVPVLEAGDTRKQMNLPGTATAGAMKTAFPLIDRTEGFVIQGGFLDGLSKDDLLVNDASQDTVRIDTVTGPERSVIVPANATGQMKSRSPGMFRVLRLARLPGAPVNVYTGNQLPRRGLDKVLQQAAAMQKINTLRWITPFDNIVPQATVYYNTAAAGWQMNQDGKPAPVVLRNADSDTALTKLKKGTPVFLELPCPEALADALDNQIQNSNNKNIALQTDAANANYILSGILRGDTLQYGWMSRQWDAAKQADIPFHTDFFATDNTSRENRLPTDSLYDRLAKLGKIAGWLTLQSPVAESSFSFPFTLAIRNKRNQFLAGEDKPGQVATGDTLRLHFEKNAHSPAAWDSSRLFIYVFSIDPNGNMRLLFPGERTSIFDYPRGDSASWLATIRNTTPGVYHYFLLSCKERILNTEVFNQQGVITRDAAYYENPLEALINDGGVNGRDNMRTPANWMIKKVEIVTAYKPVAQIKR